MNKVKKIFAPTDCLSDDTLMKYVSGKLSPVEKHEVEMHLIDCEMCSDAVEGLSMLSDKKRITDIASELNHKIKQRVEKKEVKVIFIRQYRTQLAVAASILLVVGLVWFFRTNMKEMDSASSEKIFADKFIPPPSDLSQKETDGNTEGKQKTKLNNLTPTISQEPPATVHYTKPTIVNTEKTISSEENISLPEQTPIVNEDISAQPITAKEEKTDNNSEVTAKGNSNTISSPDSRSGDNDAALINKEVLKKQSDRKAESVSSTTASGVTVGAYDKSVTNNLSSYSKPENKKAEDKSERAKNQEENVLVLQSEKKAKHKASTKEKESIPEKVSGGYYETPVTVATPQAQNNSLQAKTNERILDSISSSTAAESDIADQTTFFDEAMTKYDKQDYAGAVLDFEQTLKQNPGDEKSLFYSAVSYLSLEQPDKAITNLNKVLQNKNSKYFDDAQWYLSLSYIKKKDSQNARKNLMEIQNNSKSKHQKQADETLKEMNK